MDLGFHLALSYRELKHPTSRQNFTNVVGQNHALMLTQCRIHSSHLFSEHERANIEAEEIRAEVGIEGLVVASRSSAPKRVLAGSCAGWTGQGWGAGRRSAHQSVSFQPTLTKDQYEGDRPPPGWID